MFFFSRRYLCLLLTAVFVGGLAACSTTDTGSQAARESSIEPAETPPPVQPETEELAEVVEEPLMPSTPEQPATLPEQPAVSDERVETPVSGATTGPAQPEQAVEGIAEFPVQPYEIEEPPAAESPSDAEIERLRRELAATESELERIRAEEEQREYAPDDAIASIDMPAQEPVAAVPADTMSEQLGQTSDEDGSIADLPGKPTEYSVYFGYDQVAIPSQYESVLEAHAEFLKANPQLDVEIQGNCDERGSREYNIALGQRRARAVKRALELLGVDGSRIDTVSFGSEKPVAFGHDEESWRLNRRADIVY